MKAFSAKIPKARPEEGKIEKKKHISEVNLKFTNLIRMEIFPLVIVAACLIGFWQFKPQLQNMFMSKGRFTALSKKDLRFVARKISSL